MARFDNVIVGGGLAAGMVAQEYRGADGDGSVLLIGREAHPPYHRPPLTKGFLRGEEPVEDTYVHSLDEWRELAVELRLSTEVAAIDPAANASSTAAWPWPPAPRRAQWEMRPPSA